LFSQARSFKMNHQDQNPIANLSPSGNASGTAEDTLHLIAKLPAPTGLEDRIHAGMLAHARSAQRAGRVLAWPAAIRVRSGWIRSAAAAAIVFVVAGGGWGIYSRVQEPHSAKVIVTPHGPAPGEFTNSGAMRTPKTLNGPVISSPATPQPAPAKVPAKTAVKPMPQTAKSNAANEAVVLQMAK
jgi:hypothetical protein